MQRRESRLMHGSPEQEGVMLKSFWAQAEELPGRIFQSTKAGAHSIGPESEVATLTRDGEKSPVPAMVKKLGPIGATLELGSRAIEISGPPTELGYENTASFTDAYKASWNKLLAEARKHGASIVRCGVNPFESINRPVVSDKERYRVVPGFQNIHRNPEINLDFRLASGEAIRLDEAAMVAAFQAFQINLGCQGVDHAIQRLNWSFAISPFLDAVSGNARFVRADVGGAEKIVDTGWSNCRMELWRTSHETRTNEQMQNGVDSRVGLPNNYFSSANDYFSRISKHPFILNDPSSALGLCIGLNWGGVRVPFRPSSNEHPGKVVPVVELRTLATQPRWEDEVALSFAYLGSLLHAETGEQDIPDFSRVKFNTHSAAKHGLNGKLFDSKWGLLPAKDAVYVALNNAMSGLKKAGMSEGLAFIERCLVPRLNAGNPSEQLANVLNKATKPTDRHMLWALNKTGMLHK